MMFVMIMLLMITIVIIFFVDDYDDIFNYVIDDNDITNDDYDEVESFPYSPLSYFHQKDELCKQHLLFPLS